MFLGHYGLALAAKRAAPRTSLGALVFAAQFLDELWPILLLLGVEQVRIVPGLMVASDLQFVYYPFSHSLLMAIVWGALVGGGYFVFRRYRRGAWVVGLLVVSHWFLDLPMHQKDLPLWPGAASPKFGWGLWNSLSLTYIIEFTILLVGISAYNRMTRPADQIGRWGWWIYVLVLVALFVTSNSPPPSERALAWMTLGIWLFVPWAWWIDKHRVLIVPDPKPARA
ncbi:MAG TPA: metal-dependent hydrolase [Gemmatimonadaceae bacterium]